MCGDIAGVFSPPVNGTYLLNVYAGGGEGNTGGMVIRRNNDILCETRIGDEAAEIGKCTTIVELNITDSIRVTGMSDVARIAGGRSGLSGHLIQANP